MDDHGRKSAELKKFKEFCRGSEYIHIDWFGQVTWNHSDNSSPRIYIYSSPLVQTIKKGKVDYKSDLSRQTQTYISVGYLPLISIGQVFTNGKLAPRRHWPHSETIEFHLDTRSISDHELSDRLHEGDYCVSHKPIAKHNWSSTHRSKYKILRGQRVTYREPGRGAPHTPIDVVIHEVALISYYYATSSTLAKALFNSHFNDFYLERKIICTKHHRPEFDPESRTGRFIYQHGFHVEDAPTIGRILFSKDNVAKRGAWRIGKSVLKHSLSVGSAVPHGYPETLFPFVGETTLTLEGRWVKKRGEKWTFLAHRIIDCSHPYPFKRLEYRDALDPRGEKANEDEARDFNWPRPTNPQYNPSVGSSMTDEKPSSDEASIFISLSNQRRTPLNSVELVRLEPEQCTHRSQSNTHTNSIDPHPSTSTGDASSGHSSSSQAVLVNEIQTQPPIKRNLEEYLQAIRAIQEKHTTWNIKNHAIGTPYPLQGVNYSCFPRLFGRLSKTDLQFSYHDRNKTKLRRFLCHEICIDGRYAYLFHGESRERLAYEGAHGTVEHLSITLLRSHAFERLSTDNFLPFIELTVRGGAWPSKGISENFVRSHTKHPGSGADKEIINRITKLIKRGLSVT